MGVALQLVTFVTPCNPAHRVARVYHRNMSLPRNSTAYPVTLLAAVTRAADLGIFPIPTQNPQALRLQFQGLRGALRREGNSSVIDSIMFCLQKEPPALILKTRDSTPEALEVAAALQATPEASSPSAADLAEETLSRILSGASNA